MEEQLNITFSDGYTLYCTNISEIYNSEIGRTELYITSESDISVRSLAAYINTSNIDTIKIKYNTGIVTYTGFNHVGPATRTIQRDSNVITISLAGEDVTSVSR